MGKLTFFNTLLFKYLYAEWLRLAKVVAGGRFLTDRVAVRERFFKWKVVV
jgi:hypothetical protein